MTADQGAESEGAGVRIHGQEGPSRLRESWGGVESAKVSSEAGGGEVRESGRDQVQEEVGGPL